MLSENCLFLLAGGLFSGILAGLLGIGGGTVLVPLLLSLHYDYAQAVATSSLAIVLTSMSGSVQNWRMGYLKLDKVFFLGLPGIITAFYGAYLLKYIPKNILEIAFGFLLLLNIYLTNLKDNLAREHNISPLKINPKINPIIARIFTGAAAGLLAGLFGVGGGIIMVPLQMLFLGEKIKQAIQTSLGVVVITSITSCFGHAREGNVLFFEGSILGLGGTIGSQLSTHYLPRIPEKLVKIFFVSFLIILAIYFFTRASS
jgi:uncharacterized membrane protein YfcA